MLWGVYHRKAQVLPIAVRHRQDPACAPGSDTISGEYIFVGCVFVGKLLEKNIAMFRCCANADQSAVRFLPPPAPPPTSRTSPKVDQGVRGEFLSLKVQTLPIGVAIITHPKRTFKVGYQWQRSPCPTRWILICRTADGAPLRPSSLFLQKTNSLPENKKHSLRQVLIRMFTRRGDH